MANSQDLIDQGMGIAMDEIWRALFGNAVVNARQGQPITGSDIADTAFVTGLNALPFGGGGAAAKGAQAAANSPELARLIALQTLRNPRVQTSQPISVLEQMAKSGDTRFRNIFEVDPNQMGRLSELTPFQRQSVVDTRAAQEQLHLGIPIDAPASARPNAYGIVTPRTPFLAASAPTREQLTMGNYLQQARARVSPNNPQLAEYGGNNAIVVFDPKKLDNVTTTAGDVGAQSFGAVRGKAAPLGSADDVARASAGPNRLDGSPSGAPFLEAQMYGANLANASKILAPNKQAQKTIRQLMREADLNVPVRLNRGAMRQTARQQAVQRRQEALRNRPRQYEPEA